MCVSGVLMGSGSSCTFSAQRETDLCVFVRWAVTPTTVFTTAAAHLRCDSSALPNLTTWLSVCLNVHLTPSSLKDSSLLTRTRGAAHSARDADFVIRIVRMCCTHRWDFVTSRTKHAHVTHFISYSNCFNHQVATLTL